MGLRNVALSPPAVVGAQRVAEVLEPEVSAVEREQLQRSADVLCSAALGSLWGNPFHDMTRVVTDR